MKTKHTDTLTFSSITHPSIDKFVELYYIIPAYQKINLLIKMYARMNN
jgi:hypothetical protein